MVQKFTPFASENKSFSWWWFGVKIGLVAVLFILWQWQQHIKKQLRTASDEIPLPLVEPKVEQSDWVPSQPDDLQKIEGIGPKIQNILRTAGIQTYAQLAATDPAELKQILVAAGLRLGDPATWPQQAALAAAAQWDQLGQFQSTLKGGRSVS